MPPRLDITARRIGMRFLQFDLGQQPKGAVAEVTLSGSEVNVLLLDAANFQNYTSDRGFQHYGTHATRSPVRLAVPRAGHWYVVVDTGGYPGSVNAAVRVLPRVPV
jgi:hypothetical protein